jgi:catechol 2,3-dioxygenase-like lactoylglutathione lyase family enzyme
MCARSAFALRDRKESIMSRYTRLVLAASGALALIGSGQIVGGQAAAQLGNASITHVGVAVRDADKAVRHFADVMGIKAPDVRTVPVDLPDGKKAEIKYVNVQLPNIGVEFAQPVTAAGPIHEHLQKFGQSIHHLGFGVKDGLEEKRDFLVSKGGKWTGGVKGGGYAFVDLKDTLGTTFELIRTTQPAAGPTAVAPTDPAPLGLRAASHVGIAVANTDSAAKAWADALGVPAPQVRDYKDSQYPPNHKWSMDAYIRLTSWRQENLGVELLGAVGKPNPWSDYVERFKGSIAQHIALPIGDRMAETIQELQKKGGKWTNGKEGGAYAYLDFVDSFGLAFELNGTARPAAAPGGAAR